MDQPKLLTLNLSEIIKEFKDVISLGIIQNPVFFPLTDPTRVYDQSSIISRMKDGYGKCLTTNKLISNFDMKPHPTFLLFRNLFILDLQECCLDEKKQIKNEYKHMAGIQELATFKIPEAQRIEAKEALDAIRNGKHHIIVFMDNIITRMTINNQRIPKATLTVEQLNKLKAWGIGINPIKKEEKVELPASFEGIRKNEKQILSSISDALIDCCSLEPIVNPVFFPASNNSQAVFDNTEITRWITSKGNCPLTREPRFVKDMRPHPTFLLFRSISILIANGQLEELLTLEEQMLPAQRTEAEAVLDAIRKNNEINTLTDQELAEKVIKGEQVASGTLTVTQLDHLKECISNLEKINDNKKEIKEGSPVVVRGSGGKEEVKDKEWELQEAKRLSQQLNAPQNALSSNNNNMPPFALQFAQRQQQQPIPAPVQAPAPVQPQVVQQPAPAPAPRPTSGIDRINGRRR